MKIRLLLVWLVLALSGAAAWANGDPASWSSEGGALVPISKDDVGITAEHLTIRFPSAKVVRREVAIVRAEYIIGATSPNPISFDIGFPVSFPFMSEEASANTPVAYVKLDGRAVPATFMTLKDLAKPNFEAWQKEINSLLKEHLALQSEVAAIREEARHKNGEWFHRDGVDKLVYWLERNNTDRNLSIGEWDSIARGLLGSDAAGFASDVSVIGWRYQDAFSWLAGDARERINLYTELSRRWDHEPLLLNPLNSQLMEAPSRGEAPAFGVFHFRIKLMPKIEHRLVVQYKQPLGFANISAFFGMRYILTPARRWGWWNKTAIDIYFPGGWHNVAIRPQAAEIGQKNELTNYHIEMGRPVENLYVSAVPTKSQAHKAKKRSVALTKAKQ